MFLSFDFEQIGLMTGVGLAIILFLGFGAFSSLFTTDREVLDVAWSGLLVRKKTGLNCLPISQVHDALFN